jgi:hypothetical protein
MKSVIDVIKEEIEGTDDSYYSPLPNYGDHLRSIDTDQILNEVEKELLKLVNESVIPTLNEKVYKVYHGTNNEFEKFDFKRASQGIVWFTDSIDSIKNQTHGGAGNKFIMTRYITINNPAGWEEYEKYGLQQLEDMGYDGVILPQGDKTDYFVFSNKNIRKAEPKQLEEKHKRKIGLPIMQLPIMGNAIEETGEANLPVYQWQENMGYDSKNQANRYRYTFKTEDGDNYIINAKIDDYYADVASAVIGGNNYEENDEDEDNEFSAWTIDFTAEGYEHNQVVNKGKLFKVMSTITAIVKNFVTKQKPDEVTIYPSKKTPEDNRRLTLYMQFINKNIPAGYHVRVIDYDIENPKIILNKVKAQVPVSEIVNEEVFNFLNEIGEANVQPYPYRMEQFYIGDEDNIEYHYYFRR